MLPLQQRSISCFFIMLGHKPLRWKSNKQHNVALSSTGDEYTSMKRVFSEPAWLTRLLVSLLSPQLFLPKLWQSGCNLHCQNPCVSWKNKTYWIRLSFCSKAAPIRPKYSTTCAYIATVNWHLHKIFTMPSTSTYSLQVGIGIKIFTPSDLRGVLKILMMLRSEMLKRLKLETKEVS